MGQIESTTSESWHRFVAQERRFLDDSALNLLRSQKPFTQFCSQVQCGLLRRAKLCFTQCRTYYPVTRRTRAPPGEMPSSGGMCLLWLRIKSVVDLQSDVAQPMCDRIQSSVVDIKASDVISKVLHTSSSDSIRAGG